MNLLKQLLWIIFLLILIVFIIILGLMSVISYIIWKYILNKILKILKFLFNSFNPDLKYFLLVCLLFEFPIFYLASHSTDDKSFYIIHMKHITNLTYRINLYEFNNIINRYKSYEILLLILLFYICFIIEDRIDNHYKDVIYDDMWLNKHFIIKIKYIEDNLTEFYSSLIMDHFEILAFILSEAYIINIAPFINSCLDLIIIAISYMEFIKKSRVHIKNIRNNRSYFYN